MMAHFDEWVSIYLNPMNDPNKEDLHQMFADSLGCSKNQAKEYCYEIIYNIPFMKERLGVTRGNWYAVC
jgi:hypothetical protein